MVTTGVYCRPVCPSRRPRLENVSFFPDAESARAAGYRPCKRCKPDGHATPDRDRARLLDACRFIESASEVPTLRTLAVALSLTPDQIRTLFRRTLGVSPKQYADAVRLARFKSSLETGDSVAAATYAAGYGSSSRLYGRAAKRLGMTPGTYRQGGAGETIHYWLWSVSYTHLTLPTSG